MGIQLRDLNPWHKERTGIGTMIALLVGGAVIGAVTALLTAPMSGSQTRYRVRRFVSEGADQVKHKIKGEVTANAGRNSQSQHA